MNRGAKKNPAVFLFFEKQKAKVQELAIEQENLYVGKSCSK